MLSGYLVFVLHAHLPFVLGYGRWPHGAEWLYEAACETYIPLLGMLRRLSTKGRKVHFTVGLTPVLCEMLASDLFRVEVKEYMRTRIEAAEDDVRCYASTGDKEKAFLARNWASFYRSLLHDFTELLEENLLGAFGRLRQEGQIEIITSSATHAYLPLLGSDASIRAQIGQGIEVYTSFFGSKPRGIWLPECGYRPAVSGFPPTAGDSFPAYRKGVEEFLAENGIDYFFLDTHILAGGEPLGENLAGFPVFPDPLEGYIPEAGVFGNPCYCPSMTGTPEQSPPTGGGPAPESRREVDQLSPHFAGSPYSDKACAFFTREPAISMQVWSQDHGYPGDSDYLEFHKKDASSGLRYWKVTDRGADLGGKGTYVPETAAMKVRSHAGHFVASVCSLLASYHTRTGRTGVLTVPFDAELFGHWWFEGVKWLETVAELLENQEEVQLARPTDVLSRVRPEQTFMLPEGSWGQGGCHSMWYNKETAWMWQSIQQAERAMQDALDRRRPANALSERILNQMGREMLLLQASDWPFLVTARTAGEYAESRFRGHEENFYRLRKMFERSGEDAGLGPESLEKLTHMERKDSVFRSIKLSCFEERTENGL